MTGPTDLDGGSCPAASPTPTGDEPALVPAVDPSPAASDHTHPRSVVGAGWMRTGAADEPTHEKTPHRAQPVGVMTQGAHSMDTPTVYDPDSTVETLARVESMLVFAGQDLAEHHTTLTTAIAAGDQRANSLIADLEALISDLDRTRSETASQVREARRQPRERAVTCTTCARRETWTADATCDPCRHTAVELMQVGA